MAVENVYRVSGREYASGKIRTWLYTDQEYAMARVVQLRRTGELHGYDTGVVQWKPVAV